MGNLMNLKNEELHGKIVEAAGELFKQQGFEKTTMEQVAAEAMTSHETLYNYFPVKEALAEAYFRVISKNIARATLESVPTLPDTRSRLIAAISSIYEWSELNPDLARVVIIYRLKIRGACKLFEEIGTQSIIADILHRGRDAGELRNDIPFEMILAYIDYLGSAILLDWLRNNGQGNLRKQIVPVVDMILFGIPGKPET
ncbi:MAG: TetR/AcrR family transcriptional regulator [Syntrophomonadaceae bacterium]|nr:TetR/AcrR family transcriptional regulator [Syntrophomonadaceae bacterium]